VQRRNEISKDKFTQVAMTIEGKVANFDVTYAGAYMHRRRSVPATTPITPMPMKPIMSPAARACSTINIISTMPATSRPAPALSAK
jgi:hypothetical protein